MAVAKQSNVFAQLSLTLILLAANLVAINTLMSRSPLFRIDLTEDKEYSLTSVTRSLIEDLDEDLTIYGYFTQRTHPKLAPLVPAIRDMIEEFRHLRLANSVLFESFDETILDRSGIASERRFTVRAILYLLAGHERHHMNVLREKYIAGGRK